MVVPSTSKSRWSWCSERPRRKILAIASTIIMIITLILTTQTSQASIPTSRTFRKKQSDELPWIARNHGVLDGGMEYVKSVSSVSPPLIVKNLVQTPTSAERNLQQDKQPVLSSQTDSSQDARSVFAEIQELISDRYPSSSSEAAKHVKELERNAQIGSGTNTESLKREIAKRLTRDLDTYGDTLHQTDSGTLDEIHEDANLYNEMKAISDQHRLSETERDRTYHPLQDVPVAKIVYEISTASHARSMVVCPCQVEDAVWLRPLASKLQLDVAGFRTVCVNNRAAILEEVKGAMSESSGGMLGPDVEYTLAPFTKSMNNVPNADIIVAWNGLDSLSSGQAYRFLTNAKSALAAKHVLIAQYPPMARSDQDAARWKAVLRDRRLNARNLHYLQQPPFMYPEPQQVFTHLDQVLFRKELAWYTADSMVNRFS